MIRLDVHGAPQPSGRPRFRRAGRFVKTYPDPRDAAPKGRVRAAWEDAGRPRLEPGPFLFRVQVLVPRPASHFTTKGALSAEGRRADPMPPGDVDNYLKLPMDLLVAVGALPDDRACADGRCSKAWADGPDHGGLTRIHAQSLPAIRRWAPTAPARRTRRRPACATTTRKATQ